MDGVIRIFRWAIGGVFLLLFLALALYNWTIFWKGFVLRRHAESWIPLVGGGLGALGIVVVPVPEIRGWWWAPLLLDWGCAPGILHTLLFYAVYWISGRGRVERAGHSGSPAPQPQKAAAIRQQILAGDQRVECPRCEQDWLVHVRLVHLGVRAVRCPECDALWTDESVREGAFVDYGTYMEEQGTSNPQDAAEIETLGFVVRSDETPPYAAVMLGARKSWEAHHKAQVAKFPEAIRSAHGHSGGHREELMASQSCGCFYCLEIYTPSEIVEWTDLDAAGQGQTALCPRCGIDSVIGNRSGFPITREFLAEMNRRWF